MGAMKEAEANQLKLTPEFLALETAKALSNNTKIYFGEKIPNIFLDNQLSSIPIIATPSPPPPQAASENLSSNGVKEQKENEKQTESSNIEEGKQCETSS